MISANVYIIARSSFVTRQLYFHLADPNIPSLVLLGSPSIRTTHTLTFLHQWYTRRRTSPARRPVRRSVLNGVQTLVDYKGEDVPRWLCKEGLGVNAA